MVAGCYKGTSSPQLPACLRWPPVPWEHRPHGGDRDPAGDKAPRCGGSSWARSDGAAWPPRVPTPCWGAWPWAPLGAGVRRPVPSPCRGPGGCAPADGRERRNYLRRAGGEPGCGLMNNAMKSVPRADFLLTGAGLGKARPWGLSVGLPRIPLWHHGAPRASLRAGGIFAMAVPMATEQNGAGIHCQGKGPRSTRGRGQHCCAVPCRGGTGAQVGRCAVLHASVLSLLSPSFPRQGLPSCAPSSAFLAYPSQKKTCLRWPCARTALCRAGGCSLHPFIPTAGAPGRWW